MAAAVRPDFDPDFASTPEWAAMYRAAGLQVVPCRMPHETQTWKRPDLSYWADLQEAQISDAAFELWYGVGGSYNGRRNMGIITGRASNNTLVVDLDEHKNPAAMGWWRGLIAVENNNLDLETVEQRTGGGGRQKLFRYPAGWHAPTNRTAIGVDIRGQGGFAVLAPSRHESGQDYAWLPGRAPWECEIDEAPQWLLDAIEALVEAYGGDQGGGTKQRTASPESDLDAFGNTVDGREALMARTVWREVLEWYRECPIEPPELRWQERAEQAYLVYERKVTTRIAGDVDKRSGLEQEGRGASAFWRKWKAAMRHWGSPRMVEEAAKPPPAPELQGPRASEPPPSPDPQQPKQCGPIKLRCGFPIERMSIPPRDWVIPGLLLKKNLSVLVAPPGSGKSLLTVQVAIALGVGLQWAGWTPRKPERTLIINAEDDIDEMHRRMFVAAEVMKVDQGQLAGQVMLPEDLQNIVIARADTRTRTIIRTPLVEELVATIIAEGIGVIVVDPFAETFEGDENSNSEVKWAGMLWREVARRTGCAVLLVHHTRKYASGMAGEADASRGGGALIGTARILGTLFAMTEDEAKVMSVPEDERGDYVRYDDAKANHSRKGAVKWFQKQSVDLGNSNGFLPSDEVGVLVPWTPPGALDGVTMHDIGQALDVIERGLIDEDGKPTGQFYAAVINNQHKERWAGKVLMRHLGLSEDAAKGLIRDWIKNDVLETFEYTDPLQRKPRAGVRVVSANRPDRPAVHV